MDRKIIVGYDPEHEGGSVLCLGRLMGEVLAAKEIIITALPWPAYLASDEDLDRMAAKEMADRFDAIRDEHKLREVETLAVASRSAALALHVAAEDEAAQLLVLGSCHRGPMGRTVAGSVGESLMHGAPCAVAIAPRGYGVDGEPSLLHFGVAYDGSEEARTALQTAIALARRCHGEVTVLTVADYPRYGYATAWSVLSAGEIVDAERRSKQATLDEALAAIPSDVHASGRLLTGPAGSQLSDASPDFDLLVLGSRAYGTVRRTLLGSTTRKVIHSAKCPLLVMPRGTEAESLGLPSPELAESSDAA